MLRGGFHANSFTSSTLTCSCVTAVVTPFPTCAAAGRRRNYRKATKAADRIASGPSRGCLAHLHKLDRGVAVAADGDVVAGEVALMLEHALAVDDPRERLRAAAPLEHDAAPLGDASARDASRDPRNYIRRGLRALRAKIDQKVALRSLRLAPRFTSFASFSSALAARCRAACQLLVSEATSSSRCEALLLSSSLRLLVSSSRSCWFSSVSLFTSARRYPSSASMDTVLIAGPTLVIVAAANCYTQTQNEGRRGIFITALHAALSHVSCGHSSLAGARPLIAHHLS